MFSCYIVIVLADGSGSGNESADKSSLQVQDTQQICFFEIHFPVKYSDRLAATAALKVLDFSSPASHAAIFFLKQ